MQRVLIIDDENDICYLISEILKDEYFVCESANNSNEAIKKFKSFSPDLIILDVWLGNSDLDGIELLKIFREINPLIPIIIISGHGTVDLAVNAIKNGAYDFIEKPFNSDKLIVTTKRALESFQLINENDKLKKIANPPIPLIGTSSFIKKLTKDIPKIAHSNSRILISGGSGSGKKLISQLIHNNSIFSDSLCLIIDIKNTSNEELELLFSNQEIDIKKNLIVKSNKTTLILNNIEFLDISFQKKLLFFIENDNFFKLMKININHKIISLTSKKLEEEVKKGNFLKSLFDRISLIKINIPTISIRREDILPICNYYLDHYNKNKKYKFYFSKNAKIKLELYDWPGNISQIINYVEKTIILNQNMNKDCNFEIDNLPIDMGEYVNSLKNYNNYELSLREARNNFEKDYLLSQIARFNGNIKKISEFTGMERTALYRKFKTLNIKTDKK